MFKFLNIGNLANSRKMFKSKSKQITENDFNWLLNSWPTDRNKNQNRKKRSKNDNFDLVGNVFS